MKKYWFLILGFTFLSIALSLLVYMYRYKFIHYFLVQRTKNLVYRSKVFNASLNYRFYEPGKNKNGKLPLILILHGAGARGNDNKAQLGTFCFRFMNRKVQKSNPSYVVVPQCPNGREWVNRSNTGIPYTHYSQDKTDESEEVKLIIELLVELKTRYPIDTNRIYITGFSMGATGTWDITTRYPDMFAGAAIFSGVSDTTKAHLITHLPIWVFSGRNDKIAPAQLNENMCEAINKHDGKCKFTTLEQVGHDCTKEAFKNKELIPWLFSNYKTID